jgi:hypothetical protein
MIHALLFLFPKETEIIAAIEIGSLVENLRT